MCFVDSSASIDVKSCELEAIDYQCKGCGSKFKALRESTRVKCPYCESVRVVKI